MCGQLLNLRPFSRSDIQGVLRLQLRTGVCLAQRDISVQYGFIANIIWRHPILKSKSNRSIFFFKFGLEDWNIEPKLEMPRPDNIREGEFHAEGAM